MAEILIWLIIGTGAINLKIANLKTLTATSTQYPINITTITIPAIVDKPKKYEKAYLPEPMILANSPPSYSHPTFISDNISPVDDDGLLYVLNTSLSIFGQTLLFVPATTFGKTNAFNTVLENKEPTLLKLSGEVICSETPGPTINLPIVLFDKILFCNENNVPNNIP